LALMALRSRHGERSIETPGDGPAPPSSPRAGRRELFHDRAGLTTLENGLVGALIAVAFIAVASQMGGVFANLFGGIADQITQSGG